MEEQELEQQLQVITNTTLNLLDVIAELRHLTSSRLEAIEMELRTGTRQLQQAVTLLAELAEDSPGHSEEDVLADSNDRLD